MTLSARVEELAGRVGQDVKAERDARAALITVKAVLTRDETLDASDPPGVYLRRGGIVFKGVLDDGETPPSPGYWLRRPAP